MDLVTEHDLGYDEIEVLFVVIGEPDPSDMSVVSENSPWIGMISERDGGWRVSAGQGTMSRLPPNWVGMVQCQG